MAFTIPDKGTVVHDIQSILFQEYIDVLSAGIAGTECVVSGCAVIWSAGMGLSVAAGLVKSGGVLKTVSSATPTISAADTVYPRLDYVFADSTGTISVRAGTAATAPKPPTKASTDVVLAVVYVPANATVLSALHVVDLRVVTDNGSASLTTDGYQILPNGLIFQWGRSLATISALGTLNITFPLAFRGDVFYSSVQPVTYGGTNSQAAQASCVATTLTNLLITNNDIDTTITQLRWFAIGN